MTVVLDSWRFAVKDRQQAVHEGLADMKVPGHVTVADGPAPRVRTGSTKRVAAAADEGASVIGAVHLAIGAIT